MHNKTEYKKGLACALGCSLLWGILPVYWKSLQSIDPLLIMFYRLVLCFVLVLFIDLFLFGWDAIMEPLRKKGAKLTFFLAGTLISSNWGIYIWAVNSGFIIQTSIGYYIEPLMVCVFGVIFFHEKLDKYKITAFLGAGFLVHTAIEMILEDKIIAPYVSRLFIEVFPWLVGLVIIFYGIYVTRRGIDWKHRMIK